MHKRIEPSPAGYYIGQLRQRYTRSWSTVTDECASAVEATDKVLSRKQITESGRVLFLKPVASHKPVVVMELERT